VSPQDYDYLDRLLKARSGLVLPADKRYVIEGRLLPLARRRGLPSLAALVAALRGPAAEELAAEAVEAMTNNESLFFRDKTPFENFRDTIMPSLLAARTASRHIRIWCAAASTGQEPYTLAMCLKEMGRQLDGWRIDILATDLSGEVLEKARNGIYSQFEVQRGLPVAMLIKYFSQCAEAWQLAPELRAMVRFQPFNLLDDFAPLGIFDVVFCRNVLIYFDRDTKTDVLNRIGRVLPADGFLVLGGAETVVGLTDAFTPVPDKRNLYAPRAARGPVAVAPENAAAMRRVALADGAR
jgi:chemotaxis protein methyltransferase CheR